MATLTVGVNPAPSVLSEKRNSASLSERRDSVVLEIMSSFEKDATIERTTIDRGYLTMRTLFAAFVFVSLFVGMSPIFVGTASYELLSPYEELLDHQLFAGTASFIAIGVLCILAVPLGMYAHSRAGYKVTITYAIFLCTLIVVELLFTIQIGVLKHKFNTHLEYDLSRSIDVYQQDDGSSYATLVQHSWDVLHRELECCGVSNFTDWLHLRANITVPSEDYQNTTSYLRPMNEHLIPEDWLKRVPTSCCIHQESGCGRDGHRLTRNIALHTNAPVAWPRGCYDTLSTFIYKQLLIMVVTAGMMVIYQIAGVILIWRLTVVMKNIPRHLRTLKKQAPSATLHIIGHNARHSASGLNAQFSTL